MSIRLRMTIWYSCILAATLFIFGTILYFFLNYYIYDIKKSDLVQTAQGYFQQVPRKGAPPSIKLDINDIRYMAYFSQFTDRNGNITRNSQMQVNRLVFDDLEPYNLVQKTGRDGFITKDYGVPFLIYYFPLIDESGQLLGILQVGINIGEYEGFFLILRYSLILLSVLSTVLAGTLGLYLSRKSLKPIEHVINAADQVQNGSDLNKRIDYEGPDDEIGRLVSTINGMLERIQATYSELKESNLAQRRFVSDASHELRTPLTTIRGNVDLLEKMWRQAGHNLTLPDKDRLDLSLEAMGDISEEASRMSRLVNDLLSLARADAGYPMSREPLALQPIVEDTVRKANFLPRKADWRVGDLGSLEGVEVNGNRDYLQQLMFIFIENAFKYTEEGTVVIDSVRSERQIGIRIADTGMGMDKEEVPLIFERFYRADVSRGKTSGTGLGLSIARWIIDEHEGSIEVTTRKGEGTTFVIWLPVRFSAETE
jgi:two-component system OmpR family sensor kinase